MNNNNLDPFDFSQFHRYEETVPLDPNRSRGLDSPALNTQLEIQNDYAEMLDKINKHEECGIELTPEVLPQTPQPRPIPPTKNRAKKKSQKTSDVTADDNAFYKSDKMADECFSYHENHEEEIDPSRQLTAKGKTKKTKDKKSTMKEIATFLLPTFIALLIALGLRGFVFTNTTVPTGSMLNTIEIGSRLIGSKLSYSFGGEPERYDIVIFKYPDNEKQEYVKRVIGLPGETVEIVDGKVYINGSRTPLKDDFVTTGTPKGDYGPYKVPKDCYFMLGDNRGNSNDSRFWDNKFVTEKKIIAKVVFQYYPSFEKIK